MAEYILATPETLLWLEEEVLPEALKGDYTQVKMLLRILSHAIEQGAPLPAKLAAFLAGALRDISQGGNPGKAFCIMRPIGRGRSSAAIEKAVRLVFAIKLMRHENPGMSVEDAMHQVAESENVPFFTLQAAWRDYTKRVELAPDGLAAYVCFDEVK